MKRPERKPAGPKRDTKNTTGRPSTGSGTEQPKGKKLYKGRDKAQNPIYEWVEEEPEKKKKGRKLPFSPIKQDRLRKTDQKPPEYKFRSDRKAGAAREEEEIRLNKYIANAGICSRRDADILIEKGEISVNGTVITSLGYKVKRSDKVTYKNSKLNPEKPVYILLNKPKDFITTTDDPFERKTVMQLVANACEERVFPVGRLDRNTTGLLLFTNDGELSERLAHPSNQIKKIYQVTLDKPIAKKDQEAIMEGFSLEDGDVRVDDLQVLSKDKTILGLEIHSGKNRIVRRIFAHFGYDVVGLDRVVYAGLTKKDLPRGNYRFLTEKEVINLKHLGKSNKQF